MRTGELLHSYDGMLSLNFMRIQSVKTQAAALLVLGDAGKPIHEVQIDREIDNLVNPSLKGRVAFRFSESNLLGLVTAEDRPYYGLTELGSASVQAFRRYGSRVREGIRMDLVNQLTQVSTSEEGRGLHAIYPQPTPESTTLVIASNADLMHPTVYQTMKTLSEARISAVALASLTENGPDIFDDLKSRTNLGEEQALAALGALERSRLVYQTGQKRYQATILGEAVSLGLGEYLDVMQAPVQKAFKGF